MTYAMFIDDERFPAAAPNRDGNYWTMDPALSVPATAGGLEWHIARSQADVVDLLDRLGPPAHVSFDHDLGDCVPTGFDIAKMLVELDMDNRDGPGSIFAFPEAFSYTIHSMNPIGGENIDGYLGNYMSHIGRPVCES